MKRFEIIGAGFSGLTLAYFLKKQNPHFEVTVIEKSSDVGGLLQTDTTPYGVVEKAANAVIDSEELRELARDIGVDLLEANTRLKKAYFLRSRLVSWPLTVLESLKFFFKILSIFLNRSQLKLPQGISLHDWAHHYIGPAAAHYILNPAIGGIYAASTEKLSARLILGRFFSGAPKTKKRKKILSVAPEKGMNELTQKLKHWLQNNGVKFVFSNPVLGLDEKSESLRVLCVSLREAQVLLKKYNHFSRFFHLKMIDISTTTQFYDQAAPYNSFGLLYPSKEGRPFLGTLLNSKVFPSRYSKHSETWIRNTLLDRSLNEKEILKERSLLWGAKDEALLTVQSNWEKGLPLYGLELEDFLVNEWPAMRDEIKKSNIYMHGNYFGKLGLSQILISSKELAKELAGA